VRDVTGVQTCAFPILFMGSGPTLGSVPGTEEAPPPPPWESTELPGYDPEPGPLTLTPLEEASDERLTVSLALEDGAITTGGNVGRRCDATELAIAIWDSAESNLTMPLQQPDPPA